MNWKEYFFGLAEHISKKSKDPSTKVGAIAVGKANQVLETGYNGIPRGVSDTLDRMHRPEKYYWTAHAEMNLVATAARARLEGSTVYVTHLCCNECAKALINAGVEKIFVGPGTTSMPEKQFEVAMQMFREAGVTVILDCGAQIDCSQDERKNV